MGFSEKYINQFHEVADLICSKYGEEGDFVIGSYSECHYPPETIIEVLDIWVKGISKLLELIKDSSKEAYSKKYATLYRERAITYDEYYYLFRR